MSLVDSWSAADRIRLLKEHRRRERLWRMRLLAIGAHRDARNAKNPEETQRLAEEADRILAEVMRQEQVAREARAAHPVNAWRGTLPR